MFAYSGDEGQKQKPRPRPLQKGRNLSIEAIQTIQALKRASQKNQKGLIDQVFDSKFRRLLKLDMMAVLKDLLRLGPQGV